MAEETDSKERRPPVQFGIFDWMDRGTLDAADTYEQRLKIVEFADRAGFYCYHLAEHHGTPLCLTPAPSLFLAAAAQHTTRLRLGTLAYLLPLYPPIRLIEEICMLDQLSRGRLEVGLSRGASPIEMGFYNIDPEESRAIFQEALAMLIAGLSNGSVSFEGKYFSCKNARIDIRPYQRPYPPLWYPTNYPDSFPWIAQQGFNTLVSRMSPAQVREQFDLYRRVWQEHSDDPSRLNGHVREPKYGIVRHVHVAESDAEAIREAREAFTAWGRNLTYLNELYGAARPDLNPITDFDTAMESGSCIAGSPETVRRAVEQQVRESTSNYFVGAFATGTLTTEQILRSLSLFAKHVMPAFQAPRTPAT